MARKKRKKKKKRGRKKKKPFIFKVFRSILSVIVLSGSLVALFLFIQFSYSLISPEKSFSLPVVGRLGLNEITSLISVNFRNRDLDSFVGLNEQDVEEKESLAGKPRKVLGDDGNVVLKIGLVSDSESDFRSLNKAVAGLEDFDVDAAFFLGDLTRYGTVEEFKKVKEILDSSRVEFLAIPGDHDLAHSVDYGDIEGRKNFKEVFGDTSHIYEEEGHKFLLFDNSANFTKVGEEEMAWFRDHVKTSHFVFLSQPLYHPTNSRVMGVFEGDVVSTVHLQAEEMLELVRESEVRAIVAADHHFYSENKDPEREGLMHFALGALVSNKDSMRNLQSSRYALLKIYKNGDYSIEEVVL